jgi:cytochrome P450
MRRWADRIGAPADPLYSYLDVMIADRCRSLGDDLLSDLILTEAGGDELTAEELRALVVTLLVQAHRAGAALSAPSV